MADGGTPPTVSATLSLGRAWERLRNNAGVLLTLSLVLYLFDAPWTFIRFAWTAAPYSLDWWMWYGSGALVSFFLITPFRFGFLWATLQVARGIPAHVDHFTRGWRHYPAIITASFLYAVIVLFGLLLFVLPGIWFAARLGLFPYRIMAGHAGPIKALEQSWVLTRRHTHSMLLYGLLLVIVAALGLFTYGLVPLVAFPYLFLAYGELYHRMAEPDPHDPHAVARVDPSPSAPGDNVIGA